MGGGEVRTAIAWRQGDQVVTVTAATLSSIQVTPFNETVPIGQPVPYVATAIFSDGTNMVVTGASTWQSTDGTVALVSNAGGSRGLATTLASLHAAKRACKNVTS